jgi:two-component system response regulator
VKSAVLKRDTIWVADDDQDDRLIANEALASCATPYAMRFAEDGAVLLESLRDALTGIEQKPPVLPGLIILDLNMPGMSGLEVLRELKSDARLRGIPVIVWTTSRADADREASFRNGANDFLVKPNTFPEVKTALCNLARTWLSPAAP